MSCIADGNAKAVTIRIGREDQVCIFLIRKLYCEIKALTFFGIRRFYGREGRIGMLLPGNDVQIVDPQIF